jgi:hypothetical protein
VQRLSHNALEETLEEHLGNQGDVSALLDRAIAQKRLDEQMLIRNRAPQTD